MIKRLVAGVAVATAALAAMGGVAGAVPGPDAKQAFPAVCTSGTLAGQTLTVVPGKTVYLDSTQFRVTALRVEFDGKVKDQQFGKTQGTITCGGGETTPDGTFTFFAHLIEV